jgi:hypothetical protein
MAQLTSQQANELANQFLALAQSIGDFRYRHWSELSKTQHQLLASQHGSVLNYGEEILSLSTVLIMNDVANAIASIKTITAKVKSTLGSLSEVQDGINIAAAVVTLGAAIVSKNPLAVAGAIEGFAKLNKP